MIEYIRRKLLRLDNRVYSGKLTGESFLLYELISGGQSTVDNLFYNMNTRKIGLVGMWDTVAFDEVVAIKFKNKDGIQIMKDYMASGSFARGKEEKNASNSFVFVGNINLIYLNGVLWCRFLLYR